LLVTNVFTFRHPLLALQGEVCYTVIMNTKGNKAGALKWTRLSAGIYRSQCNRFEITDMKYHGGTEWILSELQLVEARFSSWGEWYEEFYTLADLIEGADTKRELQEVAQGIVDENNQTEQQ
jgi:hypothetical protein